MDPAQIVIIVIAVILGATIKSVTGMGLPVIAVPIISIFAGPEVAIAVLAIPNTIQNVLLVVASRSARHETIGLVRFSITAIIGAVIGTLLLGVVPEDVIKVLLIVILIAYITNSLRARDHRLSADAARRWSPVTGLAAGLSQGASGISGPIVGAWYHAVGVARHAFVFSVATVFLVSGAAQAVVLAQTGLLSGRLVISLLLTVLVVATIPLGSRLRERLGGRGFDRAVLGLLAVSTLALIGEVVAGRLGS